MQRTRVLRTWPSFHQRVEKAHAEEESQVMACKRKCTSRRPGSEGGRRLSSSVEVRFGKSALCQGCPGRVGQCLNSRLGKHWLGLPPEHWGQPLEHRDEGQPSFCSPHPVAECSNHPWGPLVL